MSKGRGSDSPLERHIVPIRRHVLIRKNLKHIFDEIIMLTKMNGKKSISLTRGQITECRTMQHKKMVPVNGISRPFIFSDFSH